MDTHTSKKTDSKAVIAGILAAFLLSAAFVLVAQQPAMAQESSNSTRSGAKAIPEIQGSVSVPQNVTNAFVRDNLGVPFSTAINTAQGQVEDGTVIGGRLGVVQGFLVYTFKVANYDAGTYRVVIVDAGNGSVLYTSEDLTLRNGGLGCGWGRHSGHGMKWGGGSSNEPSAQTTNA